MSWPLLLIAGILAALPAAADAACSTPDGGAGDQFYNTSYNVMQYCNGTDWINMGARGGSGPGIGALTAGNLCTSDGSTINCTTASISNGQLAGSIALSKLATTGTASSSTYLRGDGAWSAMDGGTLTGSGVAGYLTVWSGAGALTYDSSSGGQLFWDTTNHRLGIGTASPGQALSVAGSDVRLGLNDSSGANQALLDFRSGGTSKWLVGKDASNSFAIWDAAASRNAILIGSSGNVLLQQTAGNVGIGTTNPWGKLDVGGIFVTRTGVNYLGYQTGSSDAAIEIGQGRTADGNAYIDLIGDTTYTDFGGRYLRYAGANSNTEFQHRGTGKFKINALDAGGIQFATSNAARMDIDSSGKVGIGTASPSSALDVWGWIAMETPGINSGQQTGFALITLADGTALGSATNKGWQIGARGNAYTGQGNAMLYSFWNGSAWNQMLNLLPTGLIGIGTASPNGTLQVRGGANSNLLAYASPTYTTGIKLSSVNDANNANKEFELAASKFYFDTGNVGIGTSTPGRSLHVYNAYLDYVTMIDSALNSAALLLGGTSSKAAIQATALDHSTSLSLLLNPNGGNVGIGTTTPNTLLHIAGNMTATGASITFPGITVAGGYYVCINNGTGWSLQVSNGSCTHSDRRLKKDIAPLDQASSVNIMSALRPVSFKWKDGVVDERTQFGLIAQEVETVVPNLVTAEANGMKHLNYEGLIAPVISAIQRILASDFEQTKRIEALAAEFKAYRATHP